MRFEERTLEQIADELDWWAETLNTSLLDNIIKEIRFHGKQRPNGARSDELGTRVHHRRSRRNAVSNADGCQAGGRMSSAMCEALSQIEVLFNATNADGSNDESLPIHAGTIARKGVKVLTAGHTQNIALSIDAAHGGLNPLTRAEQLQGTIAHETVRSQLKAVLDAIRVELTSREFRPAEPLIAALDSAGACVLEWPIGGRRLGFSLEPNPKESGWFLIGSKSAGRDTSYGSLNLSEMSWLLDRLFHRP